MNQRDCEHGRQRRKCEVCDLLACEAENKTLRTVVEKVANLNPTEIGPGMLAQIVAEARCALMPRPRGP